MNERKHPVLAWVKYLIKKSWELFVVVSTFSLGDDGK